MNLIIPLDEATETRLKEQAALLGTDPLTFALEAIVDKLTPPGASPTMLPRDEWNARFEASLAAIPPTQAKYVDDSRESIYEGRGE